MQKVWSLSNILYWLNIDYYIIFVRDLCSANSLISALQYLRESDRYNTILELLEGPANERCTGRQG